MNYDEGTQHWVLEEAYYSQHDEYGVYFRGSNPYPTQLFYPDRAGGYPRAYVAEGKHANYANISECNSGGTLGTDTCEDVNMAARVAAGASLNIGSRAAHTMWQDCIPSYDPTYQYYGSGRLECYWTDQRFRGWIRTYVGGADSDAYSPRLGLMGF